MFTLNEEELASLKEQFFDEERDEPGAQHCSCPLSDIAFSRLASKPAAVRARRTSPQQCVARKHRHSARRVPVWELNDVFGEVGKEPGMCVPYVHACTPHSSAICNMHANGALEHSPVND